VSPQQSDQTVPFYRAVHGVTWRAEMERLADVVRIDDRAGIVHLVAHPADDPGS
jgi:hypothetical protein